MSDRSARRDVQIFDTNNRSEPLGGLILNNRVTQSNLYSMLEVWLLFNSPFLLKNEADTVIERNEAELMIGDYFVCGRLQAFVPNIGD